MLTLKGKLAFKIVICMHIAAGRILDAADFIENRITIPE